MSRSLAIALFGTLTLGSTAFIAEPAAAMPVAGLAPVASRSATDGEVLQARFVRRGVIVRRPFVYHRRAPVRRVLRRVL